MTALIVVGIVAVGVLVVVQGLVLLEVVRQLAQIRKVIDLDDRPVPISLGNLAGRPVPEPARDSMSNGVFVLLSTDCATCRLVAAGLPDLLTRFEDHEIVAVLQAHNHDEATEMLATAGLDRDQVVVDLEREYGEAFGIALRPVAVVIRDGVVSEGAIVRNPHQLQQLLENLESSTKHAVEV